MIALPPVLWDVDRLLSVGCVVILFAGAGLSVWAVWRDGRRS